MTSPAEYKEQIMKDVNALPDEQLPAVLNLIRAVKDGDPDLAKLDERWDAFEKDSLEKDSLAVSGDDVILWPAKLGKR